MRRRAAGEPAGEEAEGAGLLSVVSTSGGQPDDDGGGWTGSATDPTVESLLARSPESKRGGDQSVPGQQDDRVVFSGYMLKRGYKFGNLLACCPACCGCRPVWKRRFFVMRGGYLFKFVSDKRTARPKGTPIPLIDAYIDAVAEDEDGEHAIAEAASEGMDLADHRRTIHIRTIRKEYMLRAETVARRDEWIKRLRYAKQIAIKVHLGHAKQTDEDRAATRAGERLFKRGIRREMTRAKQTLEMHQMMGSGAGPGSVGF